MQFYYNSGVPQRQRRTRDSRASAINRDVPSFLVYPDGSHSLGIISANSAAASSGQAQADEDFSMTDAVTGPFVVWADPVPNLRRGFWGGPVMLFYIIMAADAFLSVLILSDSIRSGPLGEQSIAAPPFELPVVSFVVGSVAKVVGLWGVYADSLRHLTIFIAVCLLISILNLMWLSTVSNLALAITDFVLVVVAGHIRNMLMGNWFSARTNGANR